MMNLLGKNLYANDWNHIYREAGLNAWIGKLESGEVTTVQTMPWDYRPWGCGAGSRGSCNNGWIQFEICEPTNLNDAQYFDAIYNEACELTAYLCKEFSLDPFGTVVMNGVNVPTILCHKDSYDLGMGCGHTDIMHWFPRFGKNMETVRNDVKNLLDQDKILQQQPQEPQPTEVKDAPHEWSTNSRLWAISHNILKGDSEGGYRLNDYATREEVIEFLYRMANLK